MIQYTDIYNPALAARLLTKVEWWHHLTADFPDLQAAAETALRCVTPQFLAIHSRIRLAMFAMLTTCPHGFSCSPISGIFQQRVESGGGAVG